MREDIKLRGWHIECKSEQPGEDFHESLFFTGNGRLGLRGYLPQDSAARPLQAGLFLAGIFDEIQGGITDIVHLPIPVYEEIEQKGKALVLTGPVSRRLDLHNGLFTAAYTLTSQEGVLQVEHQRFASLANTGLIVQRSSFCPSVDMQLHVQSGVSLAPRNNPVPDDQVKSNDVVLRLVQEDPPVFKEDAFTTTVRTPKTGLTVMQQCSLHANGFVREAPFHKAGHAAGLAYTLTAKAGVTYTIEKLCFIATSRDKDESIRSLGEDWRFEGLLQAHTAAWASRWDGIHLPPLPSNELTTAARYAAAQLVMNGPAGDDSVSIGARGLSHARYKGCYFWDTDFFLLPFYQQTHPKTARNLVQYRIQNLPTAKQHAQKTSSKGARYPWMASLDGSEQCESWDIGLSEVHITADVVFAIDRYITATGDNEIYPQAAHVYIETARFWMDRYTRDDQGHANLLFVKGPDEYCGITRNNLFTNMLVKHNLALACRAAQYLQDNLPGQYAAVGITQDEVKNWARLAKDIPLPRHPATGRLQQDDTFHLLEPVDITSLKSGNGASYHHVTFDRLQRYKVIKQADLILLMTRMPDAFTQEERMQAWEDYEPLCLHDSTLSFATHALFAAQNGLTEAAEQYLEKALLLDLRDIMHNTGKEGLHLACFGEAWQALQCLYGK